MSRIHPPPSSPHSLQTTLLLYRLLHHGSSQISLHQADPLLPPTLTHPLSTPYRAANTLSHNPKIHNKNKQNTQQKQTKQQFPKQNTVQKLKPKLEIEKQTKQHTIHNKNKINQFQ
jgi:hypothetical protein